MKGDIMHQYVKKAVVKATYPICADLVNQLIQELKREGITARMSLVGSGRRNMVTQNGNKPFDYDFNVKIIDAPNIRDCRNIKNLIMACFDDVLEWNGFPNCKDSTSVISTKVLKINNTKCKIDICIINTDKQDNWYRLVHKKTGNVAWDQYMWEKGFNSAEIFHREEILRQEPVIWNEVRDRYLEKKDMYLSRQDDNHPSFVCYAEVINETYDKYYLRSNYSKQYVNGFHNMYENVNHW
jgi:hypothetical protein